MHKAMIASLLLALTVSGCIDQAYTSTPTKTPRPIVPHTPFPTLVATTQAPTAAPTTQAPTPPTADVTQLAASPSTPGTATITPVPPTADPNLPAEHYYMIRPIPTGWTDYADRTYAYGSTSGGQYRPHTGEEFRNPESTPVVAVGNATVIHAGDDLARQFGPNTAFYGILVVLQMTDFTYNGQPVYALYGHLSTTHVNAGDAVAVGDVIGEVGQTGIAIGPHLHFEVRVGNPDNYFTSTRNPDLWIRPWGGYGTLAGRVVNAGGSMLKEVAITVKGIDATRYTWSYAGDENISDENWNENFTLGDLPEGWYTVTTRGGSKIFSQEIYIRSGHTTWLDIELP
jgi:murein DD-endopeptidase MepM/ murein hydrolase activator NlpD